ncbi:MAG: TetR/AcrR family transcriptional regulator [bacterium]
MADSTRRWFGASQTRTRIIEATARAALEYGLRNMTVQHILEQASLSRRTFYQHFRNKEEAALGLYRSVSRALVSEVRESMRKTTDPGRRLTAGLEAYVRFHQEVGELVAMLQTEAAPVDSILAPLREETVDSLVSLVDKEVRESRGKALDPAIYRCLILGLDGLIIHHRATNGRNADLGRIKRVVASLFTATLAVAFDMPRADDAP